MIYFTSDTHFGHKNIIKLCNRPFKDLDEMNNKLIHNWNSRVKEGDTIFHLGDFCFKNSNEERGEGIRVNAKGWLSKLNGNIIVVKGNHDNNNSMNTPIERIEIKYGGKKILLIHNSDDYEYKKGEFDLILCGHIHQAWEQEKIKKIPIVNVGIDVWDYRPVSINKILDRIK